MSTPTHSNCFVSTGLAKSTKLQQKSQSLGNIQVRSKEPVKIYSGPSFQESIKHLKLKMGELEKKMKKRPMESEKPPQEQIKSAQIDSICLRKTAPFENYHSQSPTSTKSEKVHQNCYELLSKAGQMIKKSYNISARLNQSQQIHKEKCNNILNTSTSNASFLGASYSYSLSFKKKVHHNSNQSWSPMLKAEFQVTKTQKNQKLISKSGIYKCEIPRTNFLTLEKVKVQAEFHQKQEILKEDFELIKLLGKGKFGEVYLGRHIQTSFLVAIKKVSKDRLIEYNMIERFSKQIFLHSKLNHPNIVQFYGYYEEKENICLVLQYLSGGTLFDFQNNKGTFTVKEATVFLKDIINALTYLHDQHIAHRDIKPENIVLTATGIAKLCDFGWSTVVQQMRTTFCGTLDYAPPEILEQRKYDWSVDVWCVGILAYELLIGHAPFQYIDRQKKMQKIVNIDKTGLPGLEKIPEQAQQFISALLQKDPQSRPKITELLDFRLFVDAIKKTQAPRLI